MNCDELMAALVDFLGGELVAEVHESVQVHISGCAKCEAYVATYSHTVKVVRTLPKCTALSPEFEARLRKAIEPELGEEASS